MDMRARFLGMAAKLETRSVSAHAVASGYFDVLDALYAEPHRKYHGMHHIENLLQRLDMLTPFSRPGFDRFLEAEVAIWFHDAVYDIRSKQNEETSALLARGF